MKKHAFLSLPAVAALITSGCTAQIERSSELSAISSAVQTVAQSTAVSTTFTTTAPINENTTSETTAVPEADIQYHNNSVGGGYVAESADCLYYIDRETLYRLEQGHDRATVLLSMRGIAQLNVYDENTLYCTSPDGIYRINTQTGDAELVYPMTLLAGTWSALIVAGEAAYFSDGMSLRKSDLHFEETEIVYTSEHTLIDQLVYANNTLYFSAYRPDSTVVENDRHSGVFACLPEGILQIYSGYCAGITAMSDGLCISATREQALLHLSYDPTDTNTTILRNGQFGAICATPYGIIANDTSMNLVLLDTATDETHTLGAGYCLNTAKDTLYYLSLSNGALCRISFTEMQAAAAS